MYEVQVDTMITIELPPPLSETGVHPGWLQFFIPESKET
jgi:hypothetical protein